MDSLQFQTGSNHFQIVSFQNLYWHCSVERLILIHAVPREAIESLWTSYNLYGEGWGLDLPSLSKIFNGAGYLTAQCGKHVLSIDLSKSSNCHLASLSGFTDSNLKTLFEAFDTDRNGLVDALELIIAIALISGKPAIK